MARNLCHLFALFQRKGWDMKSRYGSLRKNPAGTPENKKISYPGKGTRFGKHLFITYLKIEYTLCYHCPYMPSWLWEPFTFYFYFIKFEI